ncbi:MAG: NADH-quinone oxidoreductase subunit N [Verrucomicrobia bacterium]|nr:NADH-quinone oxidoreductase subunit N [Verrucomicrobiota bacterium]MCF7708472.1 NADH-quinone oxidoreductase subunit N [Verrucomicrobiota bacterium]
MELTLILPEIAVVVIGVILLLIDLWAPPEGKRPLIAAAAVVAGLVCICLFVFPPALGEAFGGMFVMDALALFMKQFFMAGAVLMLLFCYVAYDRLGGRVSEYGVLVLFAVAGMMFASSSNHFALFFVSIELITVSFYVLVGFRRESVMSLEAGIKYLILSAFASAVMVYGIALVYGSAATLSFDGIAAVEGGLTDNAVFLVGLLLVTAGLGFKIAVFPFQMWVPDVYQGAPVTTTAFLAAVSKAAGFILLIRLVFTAAPETFRQWQPLLMIIAGATILYGNLCAIPQRNLKRLLGYSSIAHAGYMLMGVSAMNAAGRVGVLFYLVAYMFAVMGVFMALYLAHGNPEKDDIESLGGLHLRSPLVAFSMTIGLVSLAGIPPLAGFVGKFLLIEAVVRDGMSATGGGHAWLVAVAVIGILMSIYYYLAVVRSMYRNAPDARAKPVSIHVIGRIYLYLCIAGVVIFGILPGGLVSWIKGVMTGFGS